MPPPAAPPVMLAAPATAPAPRVLVRPEEFTTRIKIPGMPQ